MTPLLSIIVPTFNEVKNINPLVERIKIALPDVPWEIIFVDDDSPDGTTQTIRTLAKEEPRVRGICRVGRRGLSSACIEGMLSSSAPFLAVLDADMQHDISLLCAMLSRVKDDGYDIAIGSRYVSGGSTGEGLSRMRQRISQAGCVIGNWAIGEQLSDPMSGFFLMRREVLEDTVHKLSGKGFKILLDILASSDNSLKYIELPYVMKKRVMGESKLSEAVIFHYLVVILTKGIFRIVPLRYLLFGVVGLTGVGVHLTALWILHERASVTFLPAYIIAALTAMTSNYLLNNRLTFLENSLAGLSLFHGLLRFYIICGMGAMLSAAVSDYIFEKMGFGWLYAGLVGIAFSSVWNFSLSSFYVWKGSKNA